MKCGSGAGVAQEAEKGHGDFMTKPAGKEPRSSLEDLLFGKELDEQKALAEQAVQAAREQFALLEEQVKTTEARLQALQAAEQELIQREAGAQARATRAEEQVKAAEARVRALQAAEQKLIQREADAQARAARAEEQAKAAEARVQALQDNTLALHAFAVKLPTGVVFSPS
ncbi:hypothetical protein FACS1894200_11790 [Spirochaetia bacterium]|nr:hypothetical protein FACS1894200_11790 [Spirochaetia bacterium]